MDAARDLGLRIAYDNAYSEITFGGVRSPSILEIPGAREIALEFHSLSKTLGIPGWRIGLAVGNQEMVDALVALRSHSDSGAPTPLQRATGVALTWYGSNGWPAEIHSHVRTHEDRLSLLENGLRELGWMTPTPRGTLYLWQRAPGDDATAFAERLLGTAGILVTPGAAFGPRGRPYVRWACTADAEDLREAIERLRSSFPSPATAGPPETHAFPARSA